MLHDGMTRLLNSSLSAFLRSVVNTSLVSVSEQSYEEFIRTLSNPTVICIFSMSPLDGSALLEINPNLIFAMYDRLLGGKGEVPEDVRELTDIEQNVIEGILNRILLNLKDSWKTIIELQPRIETLETNPGFSQIVAPNDRAAILVFDVKMGEIQGVINLCIPHLVIEPIANKLSTQLWFSGSYKGSTDETKRLVRKRLERAVVPLITQLGETEITLKEMLNLSVGDVIRLDSSPDEFLRVKVGGRVKFLAQPGLEKDKVAVRIIKKIIEGDNGDA
jgi:flagellar motor switch protein FliM